MIATTQKMASHHVNGVTSWCHRSGRHTGAHKHTTDTEQHVLGGVTYRHVKWLRNHEQRQRKVGRPSEGCPCYYVHCLTCTSSLALNGRNQNNMPVSFVCRRTSWLQSWFGMRGEEKQQVNGKRRTFHPGEVGRLLHQKVDAFCSRRLEPRGVDQWDRARFGGRKFTFFSVF